MEYASVNTTKDHFHDDFSVVKLPEFMSFLLSHLMLVIPACPNSINKSKCGGVLGIKCSVTMKMAYFKR